MTKIKLKAIVLSARPHKEKDRIIKLLSAERGIVSACATGAGKINAKNAHSARPGTLSEFVLSESKGFYYVSESDLVFSFRGIEQSIEHLTALAHVLEIAEDAAMDSTASALIYELLVYTMHALSKHKDYKVVVSAFEWRLMDIIGFSAAFDDNDQLDSAGYVFSFDTCRFYPAGTRQQVRSISLCIGCMRALMFIRQASLDKLFSFSVSDQVRDTLSEFTRRYLCERLDSKYCKLDLLDHVYKLNSEM